MWVFLTLLLSSAPLIFSVVHPTPTSLCEGGDLVVWRASTGVKHCVFDQNPNLQKLQKTKQKPKRGGGLRQINTCRQAP
jgi:hypothetical protein